MKLSEWFTDASKWCQGMCARDANGEGVSCTIASGGKRIVHPDVCSMCLYGALVTLLSHDQFESAVKRIREITSYEAIGTWNDLPGRTFEHIQKIVLQLEEA